MSDDLRKKLPPLGQNPIQKDDYANLTVDQKHQLVAGAHHATVKGASTAIMEAVNIGMEAGMKMNEMVIILIHMHDMEYAPKVIPDLIGEENLIERCRKQKIKVAVFARPIAEFAAKLRGIDGPEGQFGIYDEAAEKMLLPLEEDRLMVIVFEANRCSTIVLRYDPAKAEELLKKAAANQEAAAAAEQKP